MATTTVVVQESAKDDLPDLMDSHYNLQVAQSVSKGANAKPSYNIVYKSNFLGPNMSIGWQTLYGINWTTNVPAKGAVVQYSGSNWQPMKPGESFDIDQYGAFVANQNNPEADPTALNVGKNGYSVAVNIIVGIQDPVTKAWTPIWIDQNKLLVQGHGSYTPRNSVKLWYEEGNITATMISNQGTPSIEWDMTGTPLFYFRYVSQKGVWQQQATAFAMT